LRRDRKVGAGITELGVGPRVHDAFGGIPEPIDGLVVCIGIEQSLAEGVPA